jgi:Mrp family chromosome partitioning ATPase
VIVTGAGSTVAIDVAASAGAAGAGAADAATAFPVPAAWMTGAGAIRAAGFEDEEDEVLRFLATVGAAVFFGGSTTACGVAAGVAATGAGVTAYDAGTCARSTTGSARFGAGATAAGFDKRGTASAAPTITTTPASMNLARRVSRRAGADGRGAGDFAGGVTL